MNSFSEQCLDMARSMLSHNLDSINPDGTVTPITGEKPRSDEPGHVAFALGEYYRATGETALKGYDLIDLTARCVTAQAFTEPAGENGLAYASLGLLSFSPSKERNPVWERLVEETRQRLDKLLLTRSDYDNYWQAFNIAKAVCRYSFGLSKKDETSRLIERMVERIERAIGMRRHDDHRDIAGGTHQAEAIAAGKVEIEQDAVIARDLQRADRAFEIDRVSQFAVRPMFANQPGESARRRRFIFDQQQPHHRPPTRRRVRHAAPDGPASIRASLPNASTIRAAI